MPALGDSERARGRKGRTRVDAFLPWLLQWKHGSTSAPGARMPEKGGGIMCRVMRRLFAIALLATLGATGAWALTPDDAIRLTEKGVDDLTILAKICSDAEAWDLTADDIVYLRDLGVSNEIIQALIDPAAAASTYGFTLGDATQGGAAGNEAPAESGGSTAYVYSLGYYYGPLSRFYYCDPYFHTYMYSSGFSFGFSYWPWYYASSYWPYSYGYYPYPYFWYPCDSYYYGYGYCGSYYPTYYGSPPPGSGSYYGDVRWRDGADHGPPAFGSEKPNAPEIRSRGSSGKDVPGSLAARDPSGYSRAGGGERGSRSGVAAKDGRSVSGGRLSTGDPISSPERGISGRDQSAGGNEWRSSRGTRVIYGGKSSSRGTLQARDPSRSYLRSGEGSGSQVGRVNDGRVQAPRGGATRGQLRSRDPERTFARRESGSGNEGRRVGAGAVPRPRGSESAQVRRSESRNAPAPGRESVRQPGRGGAPQAGGSWSRGSSPAPMSGGGRGGAPQAGGARGHR